jgi:hypothetical protein
VNLSSMTVIKTYVVPPKTSSARCVKASRVRSSICLRVVNGRQERCRRVQEGHASSWIRRLERGDVRLKGCVVLSNSSSLATNRRCTVTNDQRRILDRRNPQKHKFAGSRIVQDLQLLEVLGHNLVEEGGPIGKIPRISNILNRVLVQGICLFPNIDYDSH